ncbi:MAG: hypothetical protein K6L81_01715 [Agarilytica sp.]
MKYIISLIVLLLVSSCSSLTNYKPTNVSSTGEAKMLIEKLTFGQHAKWRPDYVDIKEQYMGWGFGHVSHTKAGVAFAGNSAIGNASTTTRTTQERLYYSDIKEVQVISWKRKLKQWYLASVITTRGKRVHLLRTRYEEDAQKYADALNTLMIQHTH